MTLTQTALLVDHAAEPLLIRKTFAAFPSGVAVLAAEIDGESHSLVASSFTVGVSLDPPLVSVAVQKTSSTWPLLRAGGTFGVSVLAAGQGLVCRQLASRERAERFADVPVHALDSGALLIGGAAAWYACTVHGEFDAGDHIVGLLEVEAMSVNEGTEPLVWHGSRFRDLVPVELDAAS